MTGRIRRSQSCLGRAHELFGPKLPKLIDELNKALAA